MLIARIQPTAAAHVPFAGGGLGVVGSFVGPTQAPLTAHLTIEVGEAAVDPGDGGETAVDPGEAGGAEVVPTLDFDTTGAFGCAGPPTTVGFGAAPSVFCFFAPPTAVCAKDGLEKAHTQRKMTDIAAPLFIRSFLSAGAGNRRWPPKTSLDRAILPRLTMACTRCQFHLIATAKKGNVVKPVVIVTALLLGMLPATQADAASLADRAACLVEVLHSEELPYAPDYHHLVKATLLVTPPGGAAFETTVLKYIPWQAPPPRRGQRPRMWCDPANPGPFAFH
jgi:hypothetical protein